MPLQNACTKTSLPSHVSAAVERQAIGSNLRRILAGLMFLATPSLAQDSNQVTLKYDDGNGVSGELIEFANDVFRIQASVGVIAIPAQEVSCIGAACPEGTEPESEQGLGPVTLTTRDGQTKISGDLIEFVDGYYLIATELGEMRINADQVTCQGPGCGENEASPAKTVLLVNGDLKVQAELLGFEDNFYIVEIEQIGEVRVDANTFECRGDACP